MSAGPDLGSPPRLTTSAALHGLAAHVWRASGRVARNRSALYAGEAGLRIVVFHSTGPPMLEYLRRVIEWWRDRWHVATPDDVDDLIEGRWRNGRSDRLLVTLDDGLASQYEAAVWLARAGVRALFFVIPSLVDRTVAGYLRYHAERGVRAFAPDPDGATRGLTTTQVREILAMGHRVGAHNNAHRDLGQLHEPDDLRYEIHEAMDRVAQLTGAECRDFAVGFGQPDNLSDAATAYLRRKPNVFMCHRGLNVAGRTPRFLLRHAVEPEHPFAFTRICLEGGADHRWVDRIRDMEARVGPLPAPDARREDALPPRA